MVIAAAWFGSRGFRAAGRARSPISSIAACMSGRASILARWGQRAAWPQCFAGDVGRLWRRLCQAVRPDVRPRRSHGEHPPHRRGGRAVCVGGTDHADGFCQPLPADRAAVRRQVEERGQAGDFIEVFVDAPLEVCERTIPKGFTNRPGREQFRTSPASAIPTKRLRIRRFISRPVASRRTFWPIPC